MLGQETNALNSLASLFLERQVGVERMINAVRPDGKALLQ